MNDLYPVRCLRHNRPMRPGAVLGTPVVMTAMMTTTTANDDDDHS